MSLTVCTHCHQSVEHDGITVFRVNQLGVLPAIWACRHCLDMTAGVIDPELSVLVRDLEEVRRELHDDGADA